MDIYQNSKMKGRETNDCSVIALARGISLPYDVAHSICKKKGRKDKKGFCLMPVFKVGSNKKSSIFKGHRIGLHRRQKMTLARFAKLHPKGTYIICIYRHYCTLIDGKFYNQGNMNQRIKYYYRITKPKTNETDNQNQPECVDNAEAILQDSQALQTECSEPNKQGESGILVY